ncbi:MAG TPA: anti-sigma factor, partial [Rhodocyclaceae bacterium]|nr:anti-sigma factor [Rhodocyclaceae bacterium]
IAASLVLLAAGAGGGWIAHQQLHPPIITVAAAVPGGALAHQAAIAHVVYSPDVKRPVEIGAEQEDQLIKWLSKRLGADIRPPKLGALGFELIGGRLLPGAGGPVAQFMYHDQTGQRLTVYVSTENAHNRDTAFRFAQEGPVNVFYWIDGKFGYALSAGIAKDRLAQVATAVYAQYTQPERQTATGAPQQNGLR